MIKQCDMLTVDVIVENTSDLLSTHHESVLPQSGRMRHEQEWIGGEDYCCGLHGLSLLITARVDGEEHSILMDAGPEGYGFARNSALMGIDFAAVEAVFLSHGHYDHAGGLEQAFAYISEKRGQPVPFYLHPEAFWQRARRSQGGGIKLVKGVPGPERLAALGAEPLPSRGEQFACGGLFYMSGELPPKLPNDPAGAGRRIRRRDEGSPWQGDERVTDERYLAAHIRGRGLVIFMGCAHPGVLRMLEDAAARFHDIPIYGLVGGLHLAGDAEHSIPEVVEGLCRYDIPRIHVGHCTGFRAVEAIRKEFGEQRTDPLMAGCRIVFEGA